MGKPGPPHGIITLGSNNNNGVDMSRRVLVVCVRVLIVITSDLCNNMVITRVLVTNALTIFEHVPCA